MKDSHCSHCGQAFAADQSWPRLCAYCGNMTYRNPLPVAVLVLPVEGAGRRGVLTVRRAIAPRAGQLALPGGFIEVGESWQAAAARELREEANLIIAPESIRPFAVHSAPDGTLLVFGLAAAIALERLTPFTPTAEASERVVITEPIELAFPLHTRVVADYLVGGADALARRGGPA